jgi:hypothetical protein
LLLFWLKKVRVRVRVTQLYPPARAVQESKHIVSSCWGKQKCIFPAERNHVGIGAVEKNMLLILDIISINGYNGYNGG